MSEKTQLTLRAGSEPPRLYQDVLFLPADLHPIGRQNLTQDEALLYWEPDLTLLVAPIPP